MNNGKSSREPIVFVISAPSGSGKSTLVSRLMNGVDDLIFSVSFTTRPPRGHEQPGVSYNYIDRNDFEERVARGEFLEWAKVFDNYYGTHCSVLNLAREQGKDLVLDIDVQGARQLRVKIPDAVSIFILAPSRNDLEQRLRLRSEDSQEVIDRRLREAADEIRNYGDYDYVIVNQSVEESAAVLSAIVLAERARHAKGLAIPPETESEIRRAEQARLARMEEKIRPILATFEQQQSEV